MVNSSTKNTKSRVCQSRMCYYLRTTHSSALKRLPSLLISGHLISFLLTLMENCSSFLTFPSFWLLKKISSVLLPFFQSCYLVQMNKLMVILTEKLKVCVMIKGKELNIGNIDFEFNRLKELTNYYVLHCF